MEETAGADSAVPSTAKGCRGGTDSGTAGGSAPSAACEGGGEDIFEEGGMWDRMPDGVSDAEVQEMRKRLRLSPRGGGLDQLQARISDAADRGDMEEMQVLRRELTRFMLGDEGLKDEEEEKKEEERVKARARVSPFGRCTDKGGWEWIDGPVRHDVRNMGSDDFEALVVEIR